MNASLQVTLAVILTFFFLLGCSEDSFASDPCQNLVCFEWVSKGLCNYFVEFRSFVILSKHLNRTICANVHSIKEGKTLHGQTRSSESVTSFFDVNELETFAKFEDDDVCRKCYNDSTKHKHHRSSRPSKDSTLAQSIAHTVTSFKKRNETASDVLLTLNNVGLSEFPDAPKEYLRLVHAMKPSAKIEAAADMARKVLFQDQRYMCMHWRFEETKCAFDRRGCMKDAPLGTCFRFNNHNPGASHGIRVFSMDVIREGVAEVMKKENISKLLMITDGRFRKQNQTVNAFSSHFGEDLLELNHQYMSSSDLERIRDMIPLNSPFSRFAALERKLCAKASVIIGSSTSSFYWEIAMDHAREDLEVVKSVLKLSPKGFLDPGFRREDYDSDLRNKLSFGYTPDLRTTEEKRSNVYYLETQLARYAIKKSIATKNSSLYCSS